MFAVVCFAQAAGNSVPSNAVPDAAVSTNKAGEAELDQLMAADDATMDEVDKWIRDNQAFSAQGAGESNAELNKRIHAKLDVIRKRYEDFLKRYPNSARGHLAYGTFLNDIGEEQTAAFEYKKSIALDPSNPAAWNDLGNYHGEAGPITNAFADFEKAISLDQSEPVYYENLAVMVYLYRKDAKEYYHLTEPQIFDKSLALYRKAIQLDPHNFALATDYAESYYGIRPLRTNDALVSWTNALRIAHNEVEREGVYIHLARIKIAAGRFDEAQAHLNAVTNQVYDTLKKRLERNLMERKQAATNSIVESTNTVSSPTNAPAAKP